MNTHEKSNKMSVKCLIALCHILDDYNKFDKNIKNVMTEKNEVALCNNLLKISKNEKALASRKAKKLYQENKEVINTINKYSDIRSFLFYNNNGIDEKEQKAYDLKYFYNYILSNKNHLNQIKEVLKKINNLGIYHLELNENLDFKDKIYSLNVDFKNNKQLYYLDNIEIVPNYDRYNIKYKTTDSAFEIKTKPDSSSTRNRLTNYGSDIKVNSLIFDPKSLPDKLNVSTVFHKIISLKQDIQKKCNEITNNVNLNININDIKESFNNILNSITKVEDLENKELIEDMLISIRQKIEILENISNRNLNNILETVPNDSKEEITKEKNKVLELKKDSHLI